MRSFSREWFVVTVLVLSCGRVAGAAEPDLSSPRRAATAFMTAVCDGELPNALASSIGTPEQQQRLASWILLSSSRRSYVVAASAQWGFSRNAIYQRFGSKRLVDECEQGEYRTAGAVATRTLQRADHPELEAEKLRLRSVDGKWKVDLSSVGPLLQIDGARSEKEAQVYTEEATTILQGRYTDAKDALANLDRRLSNLR